MNRIKGWILLFLLGSVWGLGYSGFMAETEPSERPPILEEDPDHWVWQLRYAFMQADKSLFEGDFILHVKERLNLTQTQEQEIENIMMANQEACIRIGAEIKIRELRLAAAMKSEKMDKPRMAQYIREISKQKTDWVIQYFNYLLDLRQLLTQKQLATLENLYFHKKNNVPTKTSVDKKDR